MIIAVAFWFLTAVTVALFVGRAWSGTVPPDQARSRTAAAADDARPAERAETQLHVHRRLFSVRSRDQVLRSGVDAIVLLAMVRALFPPPAGTSWLWVAAVVAVGVGLAGLILRWRELSPGGRPRTTMAYGVIGAALAVVLA